MQRAPSPPPPPRPDPDSQTPGITLTQLHGRSLLTTLLQTLIRPLRPHLVKPGAPLPAGSPQLRPPSSSKCVVEERLVGGVYLYDFVPKPTTITTTHRSASSSSPPEDAKLRRHHQLLYFAGGGFQSPPSREHWKLLAHLAAQLPMYRVTLVSYPLAPASPAAEALPLLLHVVEQVMREAEAEGGSVTLVGDSAGGNVALALALMVCARGEAAQADRAGVLRNVLVVSPPTDLRNANPDIDDADRHDPILSKGLIEQVAKAWAGDWSRDRWELSPLLADLGVLKRAEVAVHGILGTWDVLAPDAIKFRELCQRSGLRGEWLEWEGQMHCFPLAGVYGLREGVKGMDWIVDVLKRNA